MVNNFIEYISDRVGLNYDEKEYLLEQLSVMTYSKGELLLREGEISDKFFFNLNGFVRLYYNTDNGDATTYFYPEGSFISAYESYVHNIPAMQNFQAVEETVVVVINRETANKLLEYSPKLSAMAMLAMEEELIACQKIIASLLTKTPEQRYEYLIEEHQDYFARIPQHYIASFMGVKPESLSRIKKRYQERQKS